VVPLLGLPNLRLDHDRSSGVVQVCMHPVTRTLRMATSTFPAQVSGAVTTTAQYFDANRSIVFNAFPGYAPALIGIAGSFNGSADSCSELAWQSPYSPPGSFWCLYPVCAPSQEPPANWTNEVDFCSDGLEPPAHVDSMNINPCTSRCCWWHKFYDPGAAI